MKVRNRKFIENNPLETERNSAKYPVSIGLAKSGWMSGVVPRFSECKKFKFSLLLILILLFASVPQFMVFGQQQISGKIENMPAGKPSMDIILFMFGIDHPVKVGEVDGSGNISIAFPAELPDEIPTETIEMFEKRLVDVFSLTCLDRNSYGEDATEVAAYSGGNFGLASEEEPWAGVLFPVTDQELLKWIEDPYYHDPVIASFINVFYSTQDFDLQTICNNNLQHGENKVDVEYHYDLQLKKGFNVIEYSIEAIHKSESPDQYSGIPAIVKVTNLKNMDNIQWFAKYFY